MTFTEIINDSKPVLVDFYANWCGPCKMMTPILQQLSSMMGDQIKVLKVDVDKNQEAAMKYQVQSVPTMLLFRNGQILWKGSGVKQADQLKQIIEQYL